MIHCVMLLFTHLFFTDIDECVTELDNCHVNATCNNTFGDFHCTCDTGFEGDGVNCASETILPSLKIKVGVSN